MNLFLTRMTFHGAGPDELSRAVAVEPDVRDVDRNLGRLVNAPYRHSILVQGTEPLLKSSHLAAADPMDLLF